MPKKEFFVIPYQRIHRDDIASCWAFAKSGDYDGNLGKARKKANKLTNKQMQEIANKMGKYLINDDWHLYLKEASEEYFKKVI